MRPSFDEILSESLRRMEGGESLESVLSSYPEHADELRSHLEISAALSTAERRAASAGGTARGLQQVLSALTGSERKHKASVSARGGLAMRYAAALVAGASLALGIVFLADGLHFGGGGSSTAEAQIPHPCLEALDLNGDGQLTVEDVLLFKSAIETQDLAYDFNGDTVVDIHDGILLIHNVIDCFGNIQIPPPSP